MKDRRTSILAITLAAALAFVAGALLPDHRATTETGKDVPGAAPANDPLRAGAASGSVASPTGGMRQTPLVLPPPDTPVVDLIAQLKPRADRGSVQAACRLGAELQRCSRAAIMADSADLITRSGRPTRDSMKAAERLLRESEAAARTCAGVTAAQLRDTFRYQAISFDGGTPAMQRWLAHRPALDAGDFLSDLDGWKAYRGRAIAYARTALRRREVTDLAHLVFMHLPEGTLGLPGLARIRDDVTFVALVDAAQLNEIQVTPNAINAAARLRATFSAEQRAACTQRSAELVRPWSKPHGKLPTSFFAMDFDPAGCNAR